MNQKTIDSSVREIFVLVGYALFNVQPKEIYSLPAEIQPRSTPPSGSQHASAAQSTSIESSQETQNAIEQHVQSIENEITGERAKKVLEIMELIKAHVRETMNESIERVFRMQR